jgi:hypothetical protein
LPKFWVTVNPISTRGADYAHHSTMGLVWLKFNVAPLRAMLLYGSWGLRDSNLVHDQQLVLL